MTVKEKKKSAKLEKVVDDLKLLAGDQDADAELERLRQQVAELRKEFYTHLGPWQRAQIARHSQRPYLTDYIPLLFTDFVELHGDRAFGDDRAMIAGLAKFKGRPIAVIGQQKGRDTKQRVIRNFGQPKPEGYRKALRVMQLAAKFGRPILTFVDTPGAYPGIDAEERGQGEAIARNLREMARLPVPVIVTVTGEGGSGGALAIAVGDRINILLRQHHLARFQQGRNSGRGDEDHRERFERAGHCRRNCERAGRRSAYRLRSSGAFSGGGAGAAACRAYQRTGESAGGFAV